MKTEIREQGSEFRNEQMPRPVARKFGGKVSFWLTNMNDMMQEEGFQEVVFGMIKDIDNDDFCMLDDHQELIKQLLSEVLTLSFILNKHQRALDDFYADYEPYAFGAAEPSN